MPFCIYLVFHVGNLGNQYQNNSSALQLLRYMLSLRRNSLPRDTTSGGPLFYSKSSFARCVLHALLFSRNLR